MSKYYAMGSEDALRFLKSRDSGGQLSLEEVVRTVGFGDLANNLPIKTLETKLGAMKKRFPANLKDKDRAGGQFESQACEIVHECLEAYDAVALSDHDFWTWLAVVKFSALVEWRFGARGHHAKPANYGIGSRGENLLFRLWLRAELGKDKDMRDKYFLAKIGDQDLWRSHKGFLGFRAATNKMFDGADTTSLRT